VSEILRTTILGLFFGTFGTTLGGLLGIVIKKNSNKFLSFVLSFASGLMMAVICFDLIPEALSISSIYEIIFGILLGIISMIFCDIIVQKKFSKKEKEYSNKNELLRTGIIVSIGLAIHNFPEGLAIGSGFEASLRLGLGLAIAICLHDIPEGISMAVPMKNGGMKKTKVIWYVVLSGITTGIGAFFGAIIGSISESVIAICLSFAAGAMLYIVSGELIPESNKLYKGRMSAIGNMIGFIIGIFATKL
jgi:ZIP family zinc transporter